MNNQNIILSLKLSLNKNKSLIISDLFNLKAPQVGLELELKNMKQTTSPFKTFINKEVPMLENIAEYYKNADGKTKKSYPAASFLKNSFYEKEKMQK